MAKTIKIVKLGWNENFSTNRYCYRFTKNAIIINKSSYGLPSEFLHLDEKGRIKFNDFSLSPKDEICLAGTDSDACVLAVAFQLFDNGFAPKFIIDSIGSSSKDQFLLANLKLY